MNSWPIRCASVIRSNTAWAPAARPSSSHAVADAGVVVGVPAASASASGRGDGRGRRHGLRVGFGHRAACRSRRLAHQPRCPDRRHRRACAMPACRTFLCPRQAPDLCTEFVAARWPATKGLPNIVLGAAEVSDRQVPGDHSARRAVTESSHWAPRRPGVRMRHGPRRRHADDIDWLDVGSADARRGPPRWPWPRWLTLAVAAAGRRRRGGGDQPRPHQCAGRPSGRRPPARRPPRPAGASSPVAGDADRRHRR